jgi:hypothetical protein
VVSRKTLGGLHVSFSPQLQLHHCNPKTIL